MDFSLNAVSILLLACTTLAVIKLCVDLSRPHRRRLPLPPGPRPWPLLGNITDRPPKGGREWEFWLRHKNDYGNITSITVFGKTIVLLHSLELALELLEKRSAMYSSRPSLIFAGQMCGWDRFLALLPYNAHWKALRKPIHAVIGTKTGVSRFQSLIDTEVHRFLFRTLEDSSHLTKHARLEAGATILKMTYGYTIDAHKQDPLLDIADRALREFSEASIQEAWLVNIIPALQYLPGWVPGTGFKRTAKAWQATTVKLAEMPMRFVRRQMDEGRHADSYVSALLERGGIDNEVVKYSAASLYIGGVDTTVGMISGFFLAMILYPEVQRKAQEEIDRVTGSIRLPNFGDRDKLLYIEAIFKECFRWHSLAPLGVPHTTTAEDVYGGYRIPSGAIVFPNMWWFAHDPDIYPQPHEFLPSRFLGLRPAPDPVTHGFGFGRRICPGKELADSVIWLTIVRSLAVFDISKYVDETGREVEPEVGFSPGVSSHPLPFQARIVPRSPKCEEMIRAVEKLHPWEESSAGELEKLEL